MENQKISLLLLRASQALSGSAEGHTHNLRRKLVAELEAAAKGLDPQTAGFTPKPWTVERDSLGHLALWDDDGNNLLHSESALPLEEREANAELMADAPLLHELLLAFGDVAEAIRSTWETEGELGNSDIEGLDAITRAAHKVVDKHRPREGPANPED